MPPTGEAARLMIRSCGIQCCRKANSAVLGMFWLQRSCVRELFKTRMLVAESRRGGRRAASSSGPRLGHHRGRDNRSTTNEHTNP